MYGILQFFEKLSRLPQIMYINWMLKYITLMINMIHVLNFVLLILNSRKFKKRFETTKQNNKFENINDNYRVQLDSFQRSVDLCCICTVLSGTMTIRLDSSQAEVKFLRTFSFPILPNYMIILPLVLTKNIL